MTYATWYSVCVALRSSSIRATVVVGMPLNTVTSRRVQPETLVDRDAVDRAVAARHETCGSLIGHREHSNSITEER